MIITNIFWACATWQALFFASLFAFIINCGSCIEKPIERLWKKIKRGPLRSISEYRYSVKRAFLCVRTAEWCSVGFWTIWKRDNFACSCGGSPDGVDRAGASTNITHVYLKHLQLILQDQTLNNRSCEQNGVGADHSQPMQLCNQRTNKNINNPNKHTGPINSHLAFRIPVNPSWALYPRTSASPFSLERSSQSFPSNTDHFVLS